MRRGRTSLDTREVLESAEAAVSGLWDYLSTKAAAEEVVALVEGIDSEAASEMREALMWAARKGAVLAVLRRGVALLRGAMVG